MTAIVDRLIAQSQAHPDQVAIVWEQTSWNYGELWQRVQALCFLVLQTTVPQRSHPWIGILLPNGSEFLVSFLAAITAGGVAMVLNPDWAMPQLLKILSHHPPDCIITQSSLWQAIAPWNSLRNVVLIDQITNNSQGESLCGSQRPSIQSDQAFYIGFTSGTTGYPKGIIRTHKSWLQSFAASQVEFNIQPGVEVFVPGVLMHSLSLYTAVEALVNGNTVHLLPQFSAKGILQRAQDPRISRLVAVPTILHALSTIATRQGIVLPHLRQMIVGGSKLSQSLRQQLQACCPQAAIAEYYGASELSFVTVALSQEEVPPESVGRAFRGVTVSIRRDQDGSAADVGEIGWIGVQSPMVCTGYLEPQETGFRIQQGWATVGDRGWMDEQGYLYLVGRERDMLISNGVNVYPSEIESVILQLDAIDHAIVLGLPDDCRGDVICAVVQWREAPLSRSALVHHIQSQLDSTKCPRRFFAIPELPLTTSGKVNRWGLQAQILRGEWSSFEIRA